MTMTVQTNAPPPSIRQEIMSPSVAAQFRMALPSHIPVERFQRVTLTALNQTPDLANADRRSFFNACSKCAQDGLMPDGREAALVVFGGKVQYMPMVAGLLKLARNSGDLTAISAHVVYSGDKFTYSLGDDERLTHEPPQLGTDRGQPVGVYAIATLKSGERMREVLSIKEVEKIRAVSRAKNAGPWVQWWDEMARKSAIRRLSKRLPLSSELSDTLRQAIERDDELTDVTTAVVENASPAANVSAALAAIEQEADKQHAPAASDAPSPPSGAAAEHSTAAPTGALPDPLAGLDGPIHARAVAILAAIAKAATVRDLDKIQLAQRATLDDISAASPAAHEAIMQASRDRVAKLAGA